MQETALNQYTSREYKKSHLPDPSPSGGANGACAPGETFYSFEVGHFSPSIASALNSRCYRYRLVVLF